MKGIEVLCHAQKISSVPRSMKKISVTHINYCQTWMKGEKLYPTLYTLYDDYTQKIMATHPYNSVLRGAFDEPGLRNEWQ